MPLLARGQGGPPLITDDPDTPGNGHWEINLADVGQFSGSQVNMELPNVDANYGLGDGVELTLETGWNFVKDPGESYKSGQGTVLLGSKYRFLDQETSGVSVSAYPQFNFHPFFSSNDPEIAEPGNQMLLPIEASRHFGPWAIVSEVGYELASQSPDQIFYGVVGAYELKEDADFLLELHGDTLVDGSGTDLLVNGGFTWPFSETLGLLFALGHTVATVEGNEGQFLLYAGVQLRL